MADAADYGNEQAEYLLQVALARRKAASTSATSAECCEDCGVPIPNARRLAVVGCETCIDCQSLRERCV